MIISHKLKCIYRKNIKVAGSSFEIALSQYCGPDDIITYLSPEEEDMRISLGGYGSQNDKYFDHEGHEFRYKPHTPSKKIKDSVPPKVWDSYLKIATIRCPYDTLISRYYFGQRFYTMKKIYQLRRKKQYTKLKPREHLILWLRLLVAKTNFILQHSRTFEDFVKTKALSRETSSHIFYKKTHINGEIAADFLIRYEHLDEDIKELEAKINCPGLLDTFQNIKAKGNFRPKETAPYEMYSIYPKAKSIIDEILYEQQSQFEFLREYWPVYKSKLEEAITRHQKSIGFKLKCLVKKILFKIQSVMLGIFINKYTKRLFS